jgi:predicted permease
MGAPTATVSVIMSSEMEGDVKFASTAVTLSTLLSLFSLCLGNYLVSLLGAYSKNNKRQFVPSPDL